MNIGDTEKAFINTFDELAMSGAITAANQYAIYNERGDDTYQPGDPWVMHHNYDLWRGTQPIDNATAGLWPTGGVWLLDHAWQYYQFNKDTEYLAEVYPYMAGAAKFFTQFLVIDPQTGYLVTAASCSPEQGGVQPGPAMDTQLIRNLYDTVQKAAKILGKETEDIKGNNELSIDFEKTDNVKVFVWDGLETMKPLSGVKTASVASATDAPTSAPTSAPTTTPTEPTNAPTTALLH